MNVGWVRPLLIRGRQWAVKNAPHILMGMGTGGSITALIFAVKAAPAAQKRLQEAKHLKNEQDNGIYVVDLTLWEKIKAAAPAFVPAGLVEFLALTCFWGAHGINLKRQAVLAGLYSTAEQALIEYQRKVVEMIGDKPEKEIRNAVAQDRIDRNPPPSMVFESDTDCWCYYKGYRFRSNYWKLKDIQNDANHEMIKNLYLSESDLLWMFDPERRYIVPDSESRLKGWSVDNMMEFDIHPGLTPDHQPALTVEIHDKDGREYFPQPGFSASL